MQWIFDNWVAILLFGGFIGAHFFMHGRGGHGGGHRGKMGSNSCDHQHGEDGKAQQPVKRAAPAALTGEVAADNSTNAAEGLRRKSNWLWRIQPDRKTVAGFVASLRKRGQEPALPCK